jgi:uncharacterized membrane protein YkgB
MMSPGAKWMSKGSFHCFLLRPHLPFRNSQRVQDEIFQWGSKNVTVLIKTLARMGLLKDDLDYHFLRASMVIIYFFFGYQKWFDYEAKGLIPFFTHGPLIFWMYPVFGMKGATYFSGVSEWLFGALLFAGFWKKKLSILGAMGSVFTFLCMVTIIPFMPDGWARRQADFPPWSVMLHF